MREAKLSVMADRKVSVLNTEAYRSFQPPLKAIMSRPGAQSSQGVSRLCTPLLDHLRAPDVPKQDFGTYNALAVIAYLLQSIDAETAWVKRLAELLEKFPTSHALTIQSMGVPENWEKLALWRG